MIKEFFIGELSKIEPDWKRLEAGSEMTSFQSYDWSLLLLKDIKEKLLRSIFWKPVFICHFNGDGKIDMIAPLVVQSRSVNLRFYSMTSGICILGEKSYSDYLNFIYDGWSDEAADEIFGFIHDNYSGLELRFNNVPESSSLAKYIPPVSSFSTETVRPPYSSKTPPTPTNITNPSPRTRGKTSEPPTTGWRKAALNMK